MNLVRAQCGHENRSIEVAVAAGSPQRSSAWTQLVVIAVVAVTTDRRESEREARLSRTPSEHTRWRTGARA